MLLPVFFSSTYVLGQQRGFNNQLNDTTKRFTYFVPHDYAWRDAANNYPSTTKKLFMTEFSYHVSKLLECTLRIYLELLYPRLFAECISLNLLVSLDLEICKIIEPFHFSLIIF